MNTVVAIIGAAITVSIPLFALFYRTGKFITKFDNLNEKFTDHCNHEEKKYDEINVSLKSLDKRNRLISNFLLMKNNDPDFNSQNHIVQ